MSSGAATTWSPGPVLITGAAGFIGRHVVRQGLARGLRLHAFGPRDPQLGIPFHPGSITESAAIQAAIAAAQPAAIIHLAAAGVAYGTADTTRLFETNTMGLLHLCRAAETSSRRPAIVCAGSGFEYAPLDRPRTEADPLEPNTTYGASKAAATAIAAYYAGHLPVTMLRPFSLYGQGEGPGRLASHVIAETRAGRPVELTPGAQVRDYADVVDVADAFWRAVLVPPAPGRLRVLNVATGTAVTLRAFVELLGELLRRHGHAPDLRFGAKPYRSDEMMNYTADVGALRAAFDWVPATPLATGLARLLE